MLNQNERYDAVVFLCRIQPPHIGHIQIISKALEISNHVIVLIGSAYQPRTVKNPWLWSEREEMLRSCFTFKQNDNISVAPIEDFLYNDLQWETAVQSLVTQQISLINNKSNPTIGLIGHHKDNSSYYLDKFPQWEQIEVGNIRELNATDIRNDYLDPTQTRTLVIDDLPPPVEEYINEFKSTEAFKLLLDESKFYKMHSEMWDSAPYTPTFNCADAVVFQAGHVLVIERKNAPGKGTWALPGGYLDSSDTTLLSAAIRELKEETRLKVPAPVLKGSVFAEQVFAHPQRSLRGRIISHAFGFQLNNLDAKGRLQEVRGSDDAQNAFWVPLSKLQTVEYKSKFFEDHLSIIRWFAGRL